MLSDVLLGICASASVRGLLSLAFCCVRSCICASACFELALVSLCSQCSSLVHMLMDTSCLLYSAILRSSIVSGLFPPLPCFHCILYQCDGCPLLPFCLGAHGWVARICQPWELEVTIRSWLPKVEAPGCLGHLTSVQQCCC